MTVSNGNAIFSDKDLCIISKEEITDLKEKAKKSDNQRYRICLHKDHSDQIQEMIIAATTESYCRPHSHPDGVTESYHIYEGELLVLFFDENGSITNKVILNKDKPILRMNSSMIHMPISLTPTSVYHETILGPFIKDQNVQYASWAPCESSSNFEDFLLEMKSHGK
jgi:glucose-6-phosphate isomerase